MSHPRGHYICKRVGPVSLGHVNVGGGGVRTCECWGVGIRICECLGVEGSGSVEMYLFTPIE